MALPLLAGAPAFSQLPPITGGHAGPSTAASDLGFGTFAPTQASSFAVGSGASAESSPNTSTGPSSWLVLAGGVALVLVLVLVLRR